MTDKRPAIISAIVTIVLLLLCGVLVFLMEVVLLNGVSDSRGGTALGISVGCQGVAALLAGIGAAWSSGFLIRRFELNKTVAVILAACLWTVFGAVLALLSVFVSIAAAGIQ